ncbi:DUF2911 domain-containing protein [Cyclobacterium qasimii]|uniref:DUF2911 domain-containing protein n=2 Tax=Cyclobacterium qasimii TaxID=1350429 RepID=S7V642_9BACT|nr:DUF2911 domain-containing protein [Cyclobacterium qasimii]EPR65366.1 hypothetical protein ADICYQ_5575 [Cyclobacterium qasimii M12-11B]GEO20087.1 hypothetical protein CQA01_06210 [Cyclobacterium qasimii]
MKKNILIGVGVVFLLFVIWVVYGLFIATPASPPTTSTYSEGGLEITVDYSQPSKKGRLIFGEEADDALQPYGKYWRLGANAATEITFNKDVTFGGKPVKAGSYSMYAVPGANAFKVTLNSETNIFFGIAEPDHELDVVIVEAPVEQTATVVETFNIAIESLGQGAVINFKWDETVFTVPVALQ